MKDTHGVAQYQIVPAFMAVLILIVMKDTHGDYCRFCE